MAQAQAVVIDLNEIRRRREAERAALTVTENRTGNLAMTIMWRPMPVFTPTPLWAFAPYWVPMGR